MNKIKTFFSLKKKGFSLVEVMIVIAIIGISAGIVLRTMDTTQKTKTELELEGRKLSAIIASQKNDAIAGKKAEGKTDPCEYTIKVVDSNKNSYSVGDCNPMSAISLPTGMTFDNEENVSFAPPSAEVTSTSTNFSLTPSVDFILRKSGQNYTVSVFSSGNVNEGFFLPTPKVCPLPFAPWSIASGATVPAYSATSVPCGALCSSVSETRSCNNGILSGSFLNQSCTVTACPPPPPVCTGSVPANAAMFANDNIGLAADTPYTYWATDTGTKCQYSCNVGYTWNSSSCMVTVFSCTGSVPANAAMFANDNVGLAANTPYTYWATDTGTKCQYSCNTGFNWNGSSCVLASNCSDGVKNGSETGIDCGGTCGACFAYTPNADWGIKDKPLSVFDVAKVTGPTLLKSMIVTSNWDSPTSSEISGNYLYVMYNHVFKTFNIATDPKNPQLTSTTPIATSNGFYRFGIYNGYLYAIAGFDGQMYIYDIKTDPSTPTLKNTIAISNYPRDVDFRSGYMYVPVGPGSGPYSLQVFDVATDPENPQLKGSVAAAINGDITISNGFAYIFGLGLQTFNISNNPMNPQSTSVFPLSNALSLNSGVVHGNYLYAMAGNSSSVRVFDISTPSNPQSKGTFATKSNPYSGAIMNDFLYVACAANPGFLDIFDIGTTPGSLILKSSTAAGVRPYSITIRD